MSTPLRGDSGGNSVQDLHTPGLAPLAREVKSLYGTSCNPRASPLIAAYFVDETFRFGSSNAGSALSGFRNEIEVPCVHDDP